MIAPGKCPVHPRGRLILPTSLLWFDAKSRKLSRFDAMTSGHATVEKPLRKTITSATCGRSMLCDENS
jgi:hypothetical protein